MTVEQIAMSKIVSEWLEERDWVGMVRTPFHPHALDCEIVDDLVSFVLQRERTAKIALMKELEDAAARRDK